MIPKKELVQLRDASVQSAKWLVERDRLIVEARVAGCTWEQIAEAASMSRMGVIKVVNRATEG